MAGRGTTTRTPRCQLARVAERSWTTGRRKDELAAGASGKAGKGPLPKLPGRDLYRAAADRRNPPRATTRESSRQACSADRNSTTTQLRKTDALAASSAPPGWRRHWCRPSAQVQSRFCAGVRIGAWAGAGRRLLYARRPQLPGTKRTPGPTRAHRRPRVQPAARHNLSSQNSREREMWPARLRFACYRQRRGLPQLIAL